jgi:hypothetical protein
MKVKNLYRDEMLRYVSGCESGVCSVIELVMVYKDLGKSRNIDRSFVRKRVEKFCRKYGKEVSEVELSNGYIVKNVKNFYKFN